jgi:hypothetical protein
MSYLFEGITLNKIVDGHGNPRFIEGNGTPISLAGVTISYCRWSLSGTHLMLCVAGTVTNGTSIATNSNLAQFTLPVFVHSKTASIFNNLVDRKFLNFYGSDYTSQQVAINLTKQTTTISIQTGGSFTASKNRSFRFQFDVMIDSE